MTGTARLSLLLAISGAVLAGGSGAVMLLADGGAVTTIATLSTLAGAALLIAGLVSLAFVAATARSFEWFLAWRYLRRSRRSWATLFVGLVLVVASGALFLAAHLAMPDPIGGITVGPTPLVRYLQAAGIGVFRLGSWVLIFGVLLLGFSVFTCISIFGVYLGTVALVVVLSVMGGFESDLRRKILGTRAHVVVTKPKRMFTDYRRTLARVAAIPGVAAASPYVESEVMITSQTNLSGVLLHGIDPRRIGKVTDLARYMRAEGGAGRLENLLHPERLAKIPAIPPFRPVVGGGGRAVSRPTSQRSSGRGAATQPATAPASVPASVPTSRPAKPRPVYPGLIVGAELARNLRLYVGDDVNLVSPLGGMSPAGPIPKSRPFRIAGIFYSGMYEYDTKFAYVTIPEAQRFLGLDDEITGIELKAVDVREASGLARQIAAALGGAFEVRDWQQLNRNLFSALKLEKVVMFIVLTFIVLVASFSIVTNLIMMVLEKGREIAALKAIGASDRALLKVFIYAGVYIGAIGMLVGVIEGIGICTYLAQVGLPLDPEVYYISELPVRMSAPDIALVAVAGLTLSFLATIYPAMRAARLAPVEGLRYEG